MLISNAITPCMRQGRGRPAGSGAPFLLDDYPGALSAYSLRALSASTTSVARVRRGSDNAEADFTAAEAENGTLETWVGAGNDGFVVTMYDQSGNGYDATQPSAGNQPKAVDNGVIVTSGGKPSVLYSRSRETTLVLPVAAHSFSNETSKSAIMVFDLNATVDFARPIYFGNNGSSVITLRTGTNQPIMTFGGFSNSFNFTMDLGVKTLAWAEDLGGSQRIYINDADRGSNGLGGNLVSDEALIGGFLSSNFWEGTISEVILYPSDQSTNRTAIQNDLASHYGITLA